MFQVWKHARLEPIKPGILAHESQFEPFYAWMRFPEVLGNGRIRHMDVVKDESAKVWYNTVEEPARSRENYVSPSDHFYEFKSQGVE
jgi:hypothetical protein